MQNNSSNNKRIARNTIMLYMRMIVVMAITLYTSRILLQALGIDDFGLYNVVGGVVGLLTFFNRTMEKSTQRFLNISMVKGDSSISGVFSSSITIHILFALLFLLVGETFGLWFLNTNVVIPEDRELAANIVYQASLLSVCVSFVSIPYSAAVIAYEKMGVLAVVSVIDAMFKLCIVLFLLTSSEDRLITYGVLLFGIHIINWGMYFFYCRKKNKLLRFKISYNKDNFKKIFSFVSWTLVGQVAVVGCNQGNIVLVNMFHALTANAAMSVGNQINYAVTNLTTNFQTAFNPQITKSFAERNFDYLRSLIYTTSKISFCIMYAVALPIAYNIDIILDLWLYVVPPQANTFAILFMANGIMNAISMPFNFTVLSSENIKGFQIVTAVVFLSDLPITYLLFYLGMPATSVLWVKNVIMAMMFLVRVQYASRIVDTVNLKSVCMEILKPILLTIGVTILLSILLNTGSLSLVYRLTYTTIIELVCIAMIWHICLEKSERASLVNIIKKK